MTMTTSRAMTSMPDNERLAAQHMKWWPILLVREKRRLNGIAQRVQLDETLSPSSEGFVEQGSEAEGLLDLLDIHPDVSPLSSTTPDLEESSDHSAVLFSDFESPEDLLLRLDMEFQEQVEFARSLEPSASEFDIEPPAFGEADVLSQVPALADAAPAHNFNGHLDEKNTEANRRKLRGRGRMLGDQNNSSEEAY